MNEKFIKIIYKACIETIILYGAPFWAEAVDNVRTKKKLNKAQRLSLLRLCRAYRTAPTAALQVLSGVLLLNIRAKEEMWRWHLLNGGTIDGQDSELYKFMEIGLFPNLNEPLLSHLTSNLNGKPEVSEPHPSIAGDISILDFHDNPNYYIQIFTDGSKSHSKVGSAFAVKECNNSNFSYQASYHLASICTITQAEQFAILQALKYVNNSKIRNRHIRICSDSQVAIRRIVNNLGSLSLLIREEILCSQNSVAFSWIRGHTGVEGNSLADSLAKQAATSSATPTYWEASDIAIKTTIHSTAIQLWQREWEDGHSRRATYQYFPNISSRLQNKNFCANFHNTQLLTDHGNFRQYLHRFGLREHPYCDCDDISLQNATHLIFDCTKHDNHRINLERVTLKKGFNWPCPPQALVEDPDIFAALEKFIRATSALDPTFH
ncbi:uncharacterized protein [Centruroides vittatus]|uniref:uncharacterized protein n=1 Tax=Centruroides vittatus TaxID=120091 RepID=UPI00350EC672